MSKESELLTVGEYAITSYNSEDYWIENEAGEGMQVFRANFERFIDDLFRSEF